MNNKRVLLLFTGLCLMASGCVEGKKRPGEDGGGATDGPQDGPAKPVGDGPKSTKDGSAGAIPGKWVKVPAGTFTMGAAAGEACGDQTKERGHQVTLSRGFEIMTTEVTQAQFQQVMGYNRSYFKSCDSCPVDSVSAHEASIYCNELSKKKGLTPCYSCTGKSSSADCYLAPAFKTPYACPGYRLPTEAEWEFAYRAGTQTAFYSGGMDSSKCSVCTSKDANAHKIGWYCANVGSSSDKTKPVGGKSPNTLGLYDMAGNLYEWTTDGHVEDLGSAAVKDPYHDSNTSRWVIKGGCWEHSASKMRAAYRGTCSPNFGTILIGFRPVRTL